MAEQTATVNVAAEAAAEEKSLLDGGDVTESTQAAAASSQETPEQKTTRETEEKRILEADPATLNDTDKAKRTELEAAKEEKRLLETPKDKLSADDQVKQEKLIKAREATEKAKQGAPETYANFKVPEDVEINQPMLEEFKGLAKKFNLTQEAAQELVDLQVKYAQAINENLEKIFKDTKKEWAQETVKEFGADCKKKLALAGKAMEKFGSAELRVLLNQTGIGNHKELVKFFVKVGELVAEDTVVTGTPQSGQKSDGELFYGDTMKKT